MDDEFQELFEEETREQITKMNETLLSLEEDPTDLILIEEIYRRSHTLKGMAGTMGYETIQKISHCMEEMFDDLKTRGSSVDDQLFELLFECVDAIEALSSGEEGDFQHLIDKLEDIISGDKTGSGPVIVSTGDEWTFRLTEEITSVLEKNMDEDITLVKLTISEVEELPALRAMLLKEDIAFEYECFSPEPESVDPHQREFLIITRTVLDDTVFGKMKGFAIDIQRDKGRNILELMTKKKKEDPGVVKKPPKKEKKIELSNKIKVDLNDLEYAMNLVSEMVVCKGTLEDIAQTIDSSRLITLTYRLGTLTSELRESVIDMKMEAVKGVFARFPRMVRDIAKDNGKKVNFTMEGEEIELDRTVLDRIIDPLVHILRNSVDHGLESVEERVEKGKPPEGNLKLVASQRGEEVVISISDDGRGLDREKIRRKAVERGLLEPDAEEIPDDELFMFIFHDHFSTRDKVTNISGRGVGMSVVKNTMDTLGGDVNVISKKDEGTVIELILPPSVSIVQALLVSVADGTYAVPLDDLVETSRISLDNIEAIQKKDYIRLREEYIPLIYLGERFTGIDRDDLKGELNKLTVLIISKDKKIFGLVVDSVLSKKEIVIKPLPNNLQGMGGFSGVSILGDGSMAMILEPSHWISNGP